MYRVFHGNFILFLLDFNFYSNLTTEVIKNPPFMKFDEGT
jgi:hypothetical protein